MYNPITNTFDDSDLMIKLKAEAKSADELQNRKHDDWDSNYMLYRNKVKSNRLTQRQAVNIPLMKETIKTLLSKIDDPPNIDWQEKSGDEYKELVYQEVWNQSTKDNKLELIDILDKKNVLLYGFSAKKLNIEEDGIRVSVLDTYDITFDPLMAPSDIESARFIRHKNIFRSVREILADARYTKDGRDELKLWVDSTPGITQTTENKKEWEKKMERIKQMGVTSDKFSLFAGGDRVINLCEHYTNIWSTKTQSFERRVIVYADNQIELLNEPLKDLIGVDFWPFVVWSEDPETNDIYPDSVADLVRTPNKVLNVWFSQLIENRTLKNFQMHWFLPGQNYTPQTYTPGPGMMLPAPPGDDINKVIKPVEISGLDDTLSAINAITQIVERGSGATALDKGQPEQGQQTLGEIQILVGKANERVTAMAKFYRLAWYELAVKWNKLMHANAPKFLKLVKQGADGKLYQKRIFSGDWKSAIGYEPQVRSSSEQENDSVKSIQKFMFILSQFPNNVALRKIAQKRMLESVDLSPEELKQVEDAEVQQLQQPGQVGQPGQPQDVSQPDPNVMNDIHNSLSQLQTM